MVIVDHDQGLGLPPLFAREGVAPGEPTLFAGYAGGNFGLLAPEPTIFKESFSSLSSTFGGWRTYVDASLNNGTSSRYWMGTLTTIENSLYGVHAGFFVKALLFQP